jgi:hypothetical protein
VVFQKGNTVCKGRKISEATREKISKSNKGKAPWNKGKPHSEETRAKISNANKGHKNTLGRPHHLLETRLKISEEVKSRNWVGERNPRWKGGKKLKYIRAANKRRKRGFILVTSKNNYTEPITYHHIHPKLPYVIPCPTRIHKMFSGGEKSHFQNVNIMLGFRYEGGEEFGDRD